MLKQSIQIRPCSFVYLILMLLTVVTWFVGVSGLNGISVALPVIVLSLLKGQMIADYYMGLKRVSGVWRYVVVVWLLFTGSLISAAFYMSSGG